MNVLSGVTLLLLAALAYAAPRSPTVFQAFQPDEVEEEQVLTPVDFWNPVSYGVRFGGQDDLFGDDSDESKEDNFVHDSTFINSNPVYDNLGLNFQINEDQIPAINNDKITNIIFRDLEDRIAEDVRRMREDVQIFENLFGQMPPLFFPWGKPEDHPGLIPDGSNTATVNDPSPFDNSPFFPDNDDNDNNDGFDLFSGFQPLFPPGLLPEFPGVGFAKPGEFPANYNNETYEIHEVNGTQIAVNNTISKASGNNFNSFFHHQVIHVRPGQEEEKVTEEAFEVTTVEPATEIPQENNNTEEINTVLPEVDNEVNSLTDFSPEAIPEVNPEAKVETILELDGSRPEVSDLNSQLPENSNQEVLSRSLREFNPIIFPADDPNVPANPFPGHKSASYVASNSLEDFENVDTGNEETRAPDLSKDTRVNRVHANKQGIKQMEPDAEIFNYSLVMKEDQARVGDK